MKINPLASRPQYAQQRLAGGTLVRHQEQYYVRHHFAFLTLRINACSMVTPLETSTSYTWLSDRAMVRS
ncbi:MAG: hypothetical protein LZF86_100278 [Nitrospira sp.]|nr:MAG: hypothetical protein LZF86_100278 [Nitrospira sp.]